MQETLFPALVQIMNQNLNLGQDVSAENLLNGFKQIAAKLSWPQLSYLTSPESIRTRKEMQKGLAELREVQVKLAKAREHLLEAGSENPQDKEAIRLYREVSGFYQRRVLP